MQSAPDYVLNPLSIFRMARKSIPERHAPEKAATSSAPNSAKPNSAADADASSVDPIQLGDVETGASCDTELGLGQASLEELQTLFTAVGSGIEAAGLLPWAGGFSTTQGEPWVPAFPFSHQA